MQKEIEALLTNKVNRSKEFEPTVKHIMQMINVLQNQVGRFGKAAIKKGLPLQTIEDANKGERNNHMEP